MKLKFPYRKTELDIRRSWTNRPERIRRDSSTYITFQHFYLTIRYWKVKCLNCHLHYKRKNPLPYFGFCDDHEAHDEHTFVANKTEIRCPGLSRSRNETNSD